MKQRSEIRVMSGNIHFFKTLEVSLSIVDCALPFQFTVMVTEDYRCHRTSPSLSAWYANESLVSQNAIISY